MNNPEHQRPTTKLFDVLLLSWAIVVLLMLPLESMLPWLGKSVYAIKEAAILFLVIGYLRYRKVSIAASFRWNGIPRRIWWPTTLIAISSAVILDALDRLVTLIIPLPESQIELLRNSFTGSAPIETFWIFVGVAIVAPIVEESVFRGFLQQLFERRTDITKAILLTSLVFGLIHFQPWWLIQLLIMSVLLGYLAWRSDSIIPCVLAHFCINGLTLILFNFAPGWLIDVYIWREQVNPGITIVALIVLIYAFIIWEKRLNEETL